jgi:hypothetical protein
VPGVLSARAADRERLIILEFWEESGMAVVFLRPGGGVLPAEPLVSAAQQQGFH